MQAQRARAIGARMIRTLPLAALLAATCSIAAAQGPIDTVPRGRYLCEMPGDASGQAGIPQPERNFTIETASRYSSAQGAGVYLRRGIRLDMTSGPHQGQTFVVVHPGFLRERQADGTPGRLRCVLQR